jgi:hypothetical protein
VCLPFISSPATRHSNASTTSWLEVESNNLPREDRLSSSRPPTLFPTKINMALQGRILQNYLAMRRIRGWFVLHIFYVIIISTLVPWS